MTRGAASLCIALSSCASAEQATAPVEPAHDIEITVKTSQPAPSAPEPQPVAMAAPPDENGLSPTCQQYIAEILACTQATLANAPPETRASAMQGVEEALRATTETWKKMASPELERACAAARDALSANPSCPK